MTVPIMSLPHHLLCETFKKMDRRPLCTLRRANKTVDQTVESVRHDVSALLQTKLAVLYIRITALPQAEVGFYIVNHPFGDIYDMHFIENKHEENTIRIDDPFKQLSAIRFHAVYVAFRSFIPCENLQQQLIKIDGIQLGLAENVVLPVLKQLRAVCGRLRFEYPFEAAIELILPHIRFSKIKIRAAKLYTKTMERWPIWHCEELILSHMRDYPQDLATLLKNAKRASLVFGLKEDGLYLLADFLSEVRVNREARAKLQKLSFQATKMANKHFPDSRYDDKLRVPGLVQIWSGVPNGDWWPFMPKIPITMYKLEIDGGMAVLVEAAATFIVYFMDGVDYKEHLFFLAAHYIFPNIPFDLSGCYEEFLAEQNDETTFARLYENYQQHYATPVIV